MERNNLNGKVVLIAGGAKNLGGLLSRDFATKGAKVVIHYNSDSTKADAEKTLKDITNSGGEAIVFQADLTKVENIKHLFEEAKNKFEFFKNPKLFIYTKRQAFQNIQDAENFINRHRQMPNFFGIYLNQKQKLIGNCQLSIDKNQQKGEIAYSIDEPY